MTDFLWSLGVWNWFIVAVALFVLETIVPGVHFIWFGLAAAIVGILGLAVDIPWEWQLIAFAIISCITVFFARRFASPAVARSDEPDLNLRAAQYVGRVDGRGADRGRPRQGARRRYRGVGAGQRRAVGSAGPRHRYERLCPVGGACGFLSQASVRAAFYGLPRS